jgi:hypothetical protein
MCKIINMCTCLNNNNASRATDTHTSIFTYTQVRMASIVSARTYTRSRSSGKPDNHVCISTCASSSSLQSQEKFVCAFDSRLFVCLCVCGSHTQGIVRVANPTAICVYIQTHVLAVARCNPKHVCVYVCVCVCV